MGLFVLTKVNGPLCGNNFWATRAALSEDLCSRSVMNMTDLVLLRQESKACSLQDESIHTLVISVGIDEL